MRRQASDPVIQLGQNSYSNFEQAAEYEWLVTNGLGGFAAGTVAEANTRRYHGLLMVALNPPVDRTLLVSKIDITAHYQCRDWPLFSNEFMDGSVAPHGYRLLESFQLNQGMPVWRYAFTDVLIEKRLLMEPGRDVTQLALRVVHASSPVEFTLSPLCTYRDFHSQGQGGWEMQMEAQVDAFQITAFPGARPYHVSCPDARFTADPLWYWNFRHRVESTRGLDESEDLFRPGDFSLELKAGDSTTLVISAEEKPSTAFTELMQRHDEHCRGLTAFLPEYAPDWIQYLALAADQFIVERQRDSKVVEKTIIAGYPWFGDWGRDSMIALTGLTLVTKRFDDAANILRTFAGYISEGMLPNRFPDGADQPEYNTVDATLWYFHAIHQYTLRSGDITLAAELYPKLREIIDWHQRGTRYGIAVDPNDGLLHAGEHGVQLTWMDAKVGDWVVTPRIGKPVEVNALWYNALMVMADLAQQLDHANDASVFRKAAKRVASSFDRFWNPTRGYLYDVIDGPEGDPDDRLRPNQILAVSFPHSPLSPQRQKAVVNICAHALLTPRGLRSLAPGEPGYTPRYVGGPRKRDGAYHQGTVWAWLIGPFVDAHFRVYRDASKARSYLEPLAQHLVEAGLGSISEIFDAEPPFAPRGCFAQAWSVAEILRAWSDLNKLRKPR
ncbi:MAG: amylo-alpha-1,6-glucosidase [Pseudomonadota bacterium]